MCLTIRLTVSLEARGEVIQLVAPLLQLKKILMLLVWVAGSFVAVEKANALSLTPYFESVLVPDVSTSWTTVALDNTYGDAIPVCTYVLGTFAGNAPNYTNLPAVTRIRNVGLSSFELKIQGWENSAATTADVHCMVMDAGAHTLPDGRKVEAHRVESTQTSGQFSTDGGWDQSLLEDVSASIQHTYANPVVVGQVMSYKDARASVIYVTDCDSRQTHPFQSGMADGICVGKHIGAIPSSRSTETIGYIVGEAGSGTVNNVFYELALGSDSIDGNSNANTGESYGLARHHTMAVLTQAAEDGGNGSWAVLYGDSPLTAGAMELVVDEEIFAGDTSRNHTRERVYYWAFAGAEITLVKNVVNDAGGSAVPSDFVLSAAGPTPITGASGSVAVTKVVVQPGTYSLSESALPGYVEGSWACTGASAFSGTVVTLVGGDHSVCTITNEDVGVDLSISKSANNLTPRIGDTLTFTLVVSNAGPDTATNFHIHDPIPAGFSYVASSMTGGDLQDENFPSSPGLNWMINSLPAGDSVSLSFKATVLAP